MSAVPPDHQPLQEEVLRSPKSKHLLCASHQQGRVSPTQDQMTWPWPHPAGGPQGAGPCASLRPPEPEQTLTSSRPPVSAGRAEVPPPCPGGSGLSLTTSSHTALSLGVGAATLFFSLELETQGGQVTCLRRVVTLAESKPSPSDPEADFGSGSPGSGLSKAGI